MKNSQLHTFIHDLHGPSVAAPHAEARMRRTILNAPTRRSFRARFAQGFRLRNDPFLRSKQRFVSLGSLAVALLFVMSFTTYSYRFSPKAAADQVINQSLATLAAVPTSEFSMVQEQLGGDPAEELKTAKQAKDVKVITKQEFVALGKNATSVISMSLNSDPTAPHSGMVTISSTAIAKDGSVASGGMVTNATMARGATVTGTAGSGVGASSGSVSSDGKVVYISEGTVTTAGTPANVTTGSAGTTASSPPSAAGGESGTSVAPDGPVYTNMPVIDGAPTTFSTASGAATMSATTTAFNAADVKNMPTFKVVEPSTYLQYTDSKGRTVVLSLDAKGLPIYKTVFLAKKS